MRLGFKEILDNFLIVGDDDYISFVDIATYVGRVLQVNSDKISISDSDKLWQGTQEFITLMLENGFEAIDLELEGKCTPWVDQSSIGVIEKIKRLWVESKGDIWHTVWFNKKP